MNDLNRMIDSLKRLSHLKPNDNGLIEVKITKNALEEIIVYLEELKKLRVELETHSKALELACIQLGIISDDTDLCNGTEKGCANFACAECWKQYYLMRTRGKESLQ